MLSRIADSLFWINRYMERTDGILRLVYIHYSLSLDKDVSRNLTWKPVLEMFTGMKEEEIEKLDDQPGLVLKKILIDTSNTNSLKVLVNRAREMREVCRIILPKKYGSRSTACITWLTNLLFLIV